MFGYDIGKYISVKRKQRKLDIEKKIMEIVGQNTAEEALELTEELEDVNNLKLCDDEPSVLQEILREQLKTDISTNIENPKVEIKRDVAEDTELQQKAEDMFKQFLITQNLNLGNDDSDISSLFDIDSATDIGATSSTISLVDKSQCMPSILPGDTISFACGRSATQPTLTSVTEQPPRRQLILPEDTEGTCSYTPRSVHGGQDVFGNQNANCSGHRENNSLDFTLFVLGQAIRMGQSNHSCETNEEVDAEIDEEIDVSEREPINWKSIQIAAPRVHAESKLDNDNIPMW